MGPMSTVIDDDVFPTYYLDEVTPEDLLGVCR